MNNVDKVIDYIVSKAGTLSPEKIEALSKVVGALGGENHVTHEPNTLPVAENQEELTQDAPDDMSEITHVQIDGGPKRGVQILKS